MESKRVQPGTKKDFPMGTAEEPFWNPFFEECRKTALVVVNHQINRPDNDICIFVSCGINNKCF